MVHYKLTIKRGMLRWTKPQTMAPGLGLTEAMNAATAAVEAWEQENGTPQEARLVRYDVLGKTGMYYRMHDTGMPGGKWWDGPTATTVWL